jgi:hypothetical protein
MQPQCSLTQRPELKDTVMLPKQRWCQGSGRLHSCLDALVTGTCN